MAEVIRSGKDRILTNNGNIGININDDKMGVNDADGQVINVDQGGLVSQDSTDTGRMQIGREVKLSQPDQDVVGADIRETVLNSEQINGFQIIDTGTGTLTAGAAASVVYVDIPHNLGYQPAFLCFGFPPDTSQFWGAGYNHNFPVTYYGITAGFLVIDSIMYAQITDENLRIAVTRSTSSGSSAAGDWTYKYYILAENAT